MHEYFDHEEARRFFKLGAIAIGLLGLFLLVKTLDAFSDWRNPEAAYSTIVVNGYGEAFANPDVAEFTFSVSADAKSVGAAQDTVTEKTDAILESLRGLGIEEKDIRTTDYSVYPKYVYQNAVCGPNYCPPGRQVPDGFTVSHSVTIKVRDIEKAGQALSLAGTNGATNISSLNFTLDEPNAPQNEARDEAVTEAREKARALAKSLGVRLGRVVDFADSSYNPSPYYLRAQEGMAVSADAKAPTLPEGQNKYTSNVTITYEIR
jgi:uncharacterized protein